MMRRISLRAVVFFLTWATVGAFAVGAWGVWRSYDVQVKLCNTINAGRLPDTGLAFEDPNAINIRAELRAIWEQLGEPERSASIHNASLINCRTGKPVETKE